MGYSKFGLKLFGNQVVMSFILLFLFFLMFGAFPDSALYQWFIGILFIAIFWLALYADASYYGLNDLKRGTFHPYKGFISGFIASIPSIVLYILTLIIPLDELFGGVVYFALRSFFLIPYIKLIITFENSISALFIVLILIFPIVTGISYLDGIRRREKVRKAIEKKDAMRAELSKREN